jgi:hypothetical protein
MHDRGEHELAAEIGESLHAPVVRIGVVRPRWLLVGRQTTLNVATFLGSLAGWA